MNSKKKIIILTGLFIVLMLGASLLYNSLSETYKMDSLSVRDQNSSTDSASNSDSDTDNKNQTTSVDTTGNSGSVDSSGNSSSDDIENSSEDSSVVTAPDFAVYDMDGNKFNLSGFFGKPVIVNFWASWCDPCQMEMPDFDSAYANYKEEIEFLMINMTDGSRETVEIASSFIAEKGYTFPVYYDTDYDATMTYSVTSLPTTFFINAKGELVAHAKGAIDAETLQRGIDLLR